MNTISATPATAARAHAPHASGEAIRAEVERRRRNRLLTGMLDSLDAEYGPVYEGAGREVQGIAVSRALTGDPDDLASRLRLLNIMELFG